MSLSENLLYNNVREEVITLFHKFDLVVLPQEWQETKGSLKLWNRSIYLFHIDKEK